MPHNDCAPIVGVGTSRVANCYRNLRGSQPSKAADAFSFPEAHTAPFIMEPREQGGGSVLLTSSLASLSWNQGRWYLQQEGVTI